MQKLIKERKTLQILTLEEIQKAKVTKFSLVLDALKTITKWPEFTE